MITQISAATPELQTSSNASEPSRTAALTSDFETFLKMLTAQAMNQDPLEPIDSTEYAAQLAQFSMVEQQVQTNDLLSSIVATSGGSDLSSMADWVGMRVRSDKPAHYEGSPIMVSPNPSEQADAAFLVVRDETGGIVDRFELPVASRQVFWPADGGSGKAVVNGQYSFSVESFKGGKKISDLPAESYSRVEEAQIREGKTVLILSGGQALDIANVTAVRAGS